MSDQHMKITCIGDGAVGKTCLLISFIENRFPKDYVPTVFENYTKDHEANGKKYNLELWDTAGQEDLDSIRKLSYPDTSVLVMMYSVTSRTSFENIKTKWKVEAEENAPGVPIVLVATKVDVRDDEDLLAKLRSEPDFKELLNKEDGEKLAKQIGAAGFVECSARTQQGLTSVFDTCVKVFENSDSKSKTSKGGSCCTLM